MQVQSHYTVATILCRRQHNSIRETLKILCLSSRPVVVFTMADCSINKGCIDLRQDSQVQSRYAIATIHANRIKIVYTFFFVYTAVPLNRITIANRCVGGIAFYLRQTEQI